MLRLDLTRTVTPGMLAEALVLTSELAVSVTTEVRIELASDLTPMESIKVGRHAEPVRFTDDPSGETVTFGSSEVTARLHAPGAEITSSGDQTSLVLSWLVTVPAGGVMELDWLAGVTDNGAVVVPARGPGLAADSITDRLAGGRRGQTPGWRRGCGSRCTTSTACGWRPARRRTTRSSPPARRGTSPSSVGTACGPPGCCCRSTSARPAGRCELCGRLAGTEVDVATAQEPGKIMHELRRGTYAFNETSLPPLYYGTIDATPLWICLLHDAWRAGLAEAEVTALLPLLEGALHWLVTYGDADGDGFLEYIDASGHGLANQGWKDSGDSVRFADGRIAEGPVALCEVQGYAYEAAIGGAAMLEAFGREGADRYRGWAAGAGREVPVGVLVRGGRRTVPRAGPGRRQAAGRLRHQQHRTPPGHRSARRGRGASGGSPGRRGRPRLRSRSAHHVRSRRRLQPAQLPLRHGLAARHGDRDRRSGRAGYADLAGGLAEGLLRASLAFDRRLPELWSGEGAPCPTRRPAARRPGRPPRRSWSPRGRPLVSRSMH